MEQVTIDKNILDLDTSINIFVVQLYSCLIVFFIEDNDNEQIELKYVYLE